MALTRIFALALALSVVGTAGCTGTNDDGGSGDATLSVNVRRDALEGAIAGVVWLNLVGVTDTTVNRWFPATPIDGAHTFAINALRVGAYDVSVYAYVDNAFDPTLAGPDPADWQTPAPVRITIARGNNTVGTIWLQQNAPAGTVNNNASTVNSIVSSLYTVDSGVAATATAPAVPAEPVTLDVTLSDRDGDSMQWAWAQTFSPASAVGSGTFTPGASGLFAGTAPAANNRSFTTTYVAPTAYEGAVTLSLTVTDGNVHSPVRTVVAVPLRVGPYGKGNVAVPVAINGLPDIMAFSSTKGTLIADGADTSVITLEAVDDAADTLTATFTLTGTCGALGAVVSDQVGNTTTFQATYTASAAAGTCTIEASVTDGNPGTTATVATLGLTQATSITSYAPEFVSYSPGNLVPVVVTGEVAPLDPTAPSTVVAFDVAAVDPITGAAITDVVYSTDDAQGVIATFVDTALGTVGGSYSTDACVGGLSGSALSFTVTATATNPANGATGTVVWPITVNCL